MRFITLGGAAVVVTRQPDSPPHRNHYWECLGCLRSHSDTHWLLSEDEAREQANGHAGRCRSLPPDHDQT
jgi:hypothetical protein